MNTKYKNAEFGLKKVFLLFTDAFDFFETLNKRNDERKRSENIKLVQLHSLD